jgi:hypothetical protein
MAGELYLNPNLRTVIGGYGITTPFGVFLPPGGNVAAFVRSTGPQSNDDPALVGGMLVPTLAQALQRCRPGANDTVFILPGHTENVVDATMLTNLVAGTRIVGVGRGSVMPTFRWTTAAASWLLNKADVTITGLKLRMEGFNGVTNAIVVSAADQGIANCDIETSSGAANKVVTGIQLNAGADRFEFIGNRVRGLAAGATTDVVLVAAAVDSFRYTDNETTAPAAVGNGVLRINALATNITLARSLLINNFASATSGLTFGAFAVDGAAYDLRVGVLNAALTVAGNIIVPGSSVVKFFECYVHDGTTNSFATISPGTVVS